MDSQRISVQRIVAVKLRQRLSAVDQDSEVRDKKRGDFVSMLAIRVVANLLLLLVADAQGSWWCLQGVGTGGQRGICSGDDKL